MSGWHVQSFDNIFQYFKIFDNILKYLTIFWNIWQYIDVTLLLTVVRITLVLSARSKLPRMISYSFPSHKLWNMSTNIFVDKYGKIHLGTWRTAVFNVETYHAFKLETLRPQQVDGLLVLVRKPEQLLSILMIAILKEWQINQPEGVVVPPEFKSLQTGAEFCKAVQGSMNLPITRKTHLSIMWSTWILVEIAFEVPITRMVALLSFGM